MQLSKLTKAWFEFQDARFEIKHLLSGTLSEIEDQATKESVELVKDIDGNLNTKAVIDMKKKVKNEMTVCEAVVNWENLNDADGSSLECNKANKLRLCRELEESDYRAFLSFIAESRSALSGQVAKQQEEAKGN